jgi:signal transduction histidine kinase
VHAGTEASKITPMQDLKTQLSHPGLLEVAKLRRDMYYHQQMVPSLRLLGLSLLLLSVFFHLKYLDGVDPRPLVWRLAILYAVYGFGSWLFLLLVYRPNPRVPWGDLFLTLDPVLWILAIYHTGADHSVLFLMLLVRVADQTNSTFLRCVYFLNVTAATYLAMLGWLAWHDHPVDWPVQGAKLIFLYLAGTYISVTALTAQNWRSKTRQAVRLAKLALDELGFQNKELAEARRAAEEVSRLKSGFLATMSHELRTPLNSVIGFCQLLEEPGTGELNERQRRYLGNTLQSARRLHGLIGDILDLSKIEAGALELELGPVDLKHLLKQSVAAITAQAVARGIRIEQNHPTDLAPARADGFRLRQVCDNLLSNAVKYNNEGGQIVVATRTEGDRLVLSVQDSGPGIPPDRQERIFEAFVQLDAGYQRRSDGTGLGLALCRALCQLQKAELRVISPVSQEGGSRFEISLPIFPELDSPLLEKGRAS